MSTNLVLLAPVGAKPPLDEGLETWARRFILTPAVTDRERRVRFVVAQLLAELEAAR
jgi:hypothetical protein